MYHALCDLCEVSDDSCNVDSSVETKSKTDRSTVATTSACLCLIVIITKEVILYNYYY